VSAKRAVRSVGGSGSRTVIACSSRASDLGVEPCHLLIGNALLGVEMPGAAASAPPRTAALNAPIRAAKLLGFEIPPSVLSRADQVIE
jgi:hypothetical protein